MNERLMNSANAYILIFCTIFSASLQAQASNSAMARVVHVMGGGSTDFKQYYAELIDLALKNSEKDFGPYQLTMEKRIPTPARAIKALADGEWHTLVMSDLSPEYHAERNIEIISGPYLKALMGLRACIIRREDLQKFKSIKSMQDLKAFSIGQGAHWTETKIYQNAGLKVVTAKYYKSLFPMLKNGRFDHIPLSVLEIDNALKEVKGEFPDLVIAPDIYIYYPLPVYIAVSKKILGLSDRVKRGIEQALADNEVDTLMNKHFGKTDRRLSDAGTRLFMIDNHLIPKQRNGAALEYFKKTYINVLPEN